MSNIPSTYTTAVMSMTKRCFLFLATYKCRTWHYLHGRSERPFSIDKTITMPLYRFAESAAAVSVHNSSLFVLRVHVNHFYNCKRLSNSKSITSTLTKVKSCFHGLWWCFAIKNNSFAHQYKNNFFVKQNFKYWFWIRAPDIEFLPVIQGDVQKTQTRSTVVRKKMFVFINRTVVFICETYAHKNIALFSCV